MQGWESVRWLVIGITFLENKNVGSIYHISVSCFLIETKFIPKLLEKFRRQNECQEIPRLRLSIIFKNSSFLIIKKSGILNFKNSKSGHFVNLKNSSFPISKNPGILKFKNSKNGQLRFPKFWNSWDSDLSPKYFPVFLPGISPDFFLIFSSNSV